jgi:hypothetical protein
LKILFFGTTDIPTAICDVSTLARLTTGTLTISDTDCGSDLGAREAVEKKDPWAEFQPLHF